jgi:hypothetical protein
MLNDTNFWKEWLFNRYKIEIEQENINYIEIAKKLNYILESLRTKKLIVTINTLKILVTKFSEEGIANFIGAIKKENTIISTYDILYNILIQYDPFNLGSIWHLYPSIDLELGATVNIVHEITVFDDAGKRNRNKILDYICVATTYILPSDKLVTIKYDIDREHNILSLTSTDQFVETYHWHLREIGKNNRKIFARLIRE